jgi:hypothetical protein
VSNQLATAATLAAFCAKAINAGSATVVQKPSEKANNSSQNTLAFTGESISHTCPDGE